MGARRAPHGDTALDMNLSDWLRSERALSDFVTWAEPFGQDWARAWSECPRGDWLLALAARAGSERQELIAASAACARLALEVLDDDAAAPALEGVARAEAWARGEDASTALGAELESMLEAPDPLLGAGARAAASVLMAIEDPQSAPGAASAAVETSMLQAGECATMAAVSYAQRRSAELVRAHISRAPSAR